MARVTTAAKCRLCRREGMKLFLKGERCFTVKCAVERRGTPPGMHSWGRQRRSSYGQQLREKQRLKRVYGLLERQFRHYFASALQQKGNTGSNLIQRIELRLDNAIRASGFGYGPSSARQIVVHGHVFVNGKRCDRPSRALKPGDVIAITKNESARKHVAAIAEATRAYNPTAPEWLEVNRDGLEIKVLQLPTREQFRPEITINEQLIVEGCTK
jgi:small subunit ribosomal protein S4